MKSIGKSQILPMLFCFTKKLHKLRYNFSYLNLPLFFDTK